MKYKLIKTERLIELLENENKLIALENGGVDNWDWYGESLRLYEEEFPNGIAALSVCEDDLKIFRDYKEG